MKTARKGAALLLACLLALCAASLCGGQRAQAASDGPLTYTVRDGSATVTKCVFNAAGTLEVPAELGGAPVTAIADEAFYGCGELKEILLPETLLFIGERAFGLCFTLQRLILPESLQRLGTAAFFKCYALKSMRIPAQTALIGACPFSECTSLQSVTVDPENPVYYSAGNCVIERASGTLTVGCSFSEIPQDGSITAIGESAFEYCREMTSVTVPAGVTSLGDYAFAGCDALTALQLPEGLRQIGAYAFYNCAQMRAFDLPDSVETIGAYAFCNCDRLTSLELPESLTEISEYLLYLCPRLLRVTIPRSVRSIGRLFNDGCTLMTDIYYKGTPEDWMRVQIAQQDTEFNDAVLHYIGGTCEKSDAASGVALAFEYGTFGTPNDSTLHLRVETVAQGDARFSAYKVNVDGAQHALYEIHMEDDAGNSYQPQDGKLVTVWIPLPFVIEPESYGAMFIHHRKQDGTTKRIKYSTGALRVEADCFVFEVTSFSDFAVCSDDQGNHADTDHDHICDLCGDSLVYTVDLIVDGENLGPVTYYYNDTIVSALPPVPARPGYVGAWEFTITGAVLEIRPVYTNPTAQAEILVQPAATVDYRTRVTLTARANGVPDGDVLVLLDADGRELARGNSETVSCELGTLTANQVYTVKLIDPDGNVCIDAAEAPLERTVTVTVRSGFLQRLIAFFKGLFGRNGQVEIGP